MSKDLRQFLELAKKMGPDFYVEVKKPLKPKYEPCVIQEKLAKEGRFPVIYCPQIEGSKLPLVTNLFGSYEMLGLAIDVDARKMGKAEIIKEYHKRETDFKPTKTVPASEAPVKEVVLKGKDVDLNLLPIIHHQECDSGKYINVGSMICKDPDTGIPNVAIYRHEMKGKDVLGGMFVPVHHAAYIARRYAELGKPMEVVIIIGHHPAISIGACSTGDIKDNELELIGGLLGEPLEVTSGETVDIPVPARAEIAIEGVIDPRTMGTDGPFGEFTHYVGPEASCYIIKVTAITMRKDAIYHDLDNAHREHNFCSVLPNESHNFEAIKRAVPTVQAVHLPWSGLCEFHVYASIKKRVQGEGMFTGLAILAANAEVKLAVIVDEDVDVYNEEDVLWAITTRVQADQDVAIIPRVSGADLDPSCYDETRLKRGAMTTKMIIDATKPVQAKFAPRITPPKELWDSMKLEDYLK